MRGPQIKPCAEETCGWISLAAAQTELQGEEGLFGIGVRALTSV